VATMFLDSDIKKRHPAKAEPNRHGFASSPGASPSVLDGLDSALDAVKSLDLDTITDADVWDMLDGLVEFEARFTAVKLAVADRFARSGLWADKGHRTPGAAMRAGHNLSGAVSNGLFRNAKRAKTMPVSVAALESGEISVQHFERLGRANAGRRRIPFAEQETHLVNVAKTLAFEDFARVVTYFEQMADTYSSQKESDRQIADRRAHCAETFGGVVHLDATFDPLAGTEFAQELARLAEIEYQIDVAAAKSDYGDDIAMAMLPRTHAQRNVDALVQMARRSATTVMPGEPAVCTVDIHMDHATFVAEMAALDADAQPGTGYYPGGRRCETTSGLVLAPSTALHAALGGLVRRVVIGADGMAVDFGRRQRLLPKNLRAYVQNRDKHCTTKGCSIRGMHCQIDHIDEWHQGGDTSVANSQLECGFHNRLKHLASRSSERESHRGRKRKRWGSTPTPLSCPTPSLLS
jgi:hypothetical protein